MSRVPDFDTDEERAEYIQKWREPETYESYLIAYDPATGSGDIPAVMVIEEFTGRMKRAYALTGFGWNAQYKKLEQLSIRYNDAPIAFSQTGHESRCYE